MTKSSKIVIALSGIIIIITTLIFACGCSAQTPTAVPQGLVTTEDALQEKGLYILSSNGKSARPITCDFSQNDTGYTTSVTSAESSWIKPDVVGSYVIWNADGTEREIPEYKVDYQNGEKLVYVSGDEEEKPVYHEVMREAYWQGDDGTTAIHDITKINGEDFTDYALFNEKRMKKIATALAGDSICYTFYSKDTPEDTIASSEGKFILSCAHPANVTMGISGKDEIDVALEDQFVVASNKISKYELVEENEDLGYHVIDLKKVNQPYMLFTFGDEDQACLITISK